MERKLSEGNWIKIDQLGTFSLQMTTLNSVSDARKLQNSEVQVRNINFRTDKGLLSRLRILNMERDYQHGNIALNAETRYERILGLFHDAYYNNDFDILISRKECERENHCNSRQATEDLKELITRGKLKKVGKGNTILYMLKKQFS